MRIIIDADAFPAGIKDIVINASKRLHVPLCFVANKPVRVDTDPNISVVQVPAGPDIADDRIVELAEPGDLVITADIPLADRVIAKGAYALDPRGMLYTEENIKNRLAVRGLMQQLRDEGMVTGGPAPFDTVDRKTFANRLDRFLTANLKKNADRD